VTERGETGEEQIQEHARYFLPHKGDYSQRINPVRLNSGFRILLGRLRRLLENVRRLRPELWRQKNWLLHNDNARSHTSSFTREFLPKTT
jgi:hypothetical protein